MVSSKVSSSSSVPTGRWTYDVFLSFRGEDTRNNFVDHLYNALDQRGIRAFLDNVMLRIGKSISPALLEAIKESRFAVIVFSKNYANSTWCLEEMAKIIECHDQMGQKVIPVFYHVDPSDVRKQKGNFGTDFQEHEDKFKGEMDKVNNWRKALSAAAILSGYHISASSGGEYAFINKIVQEISGDIQPRGMDNNLIGIESRIHALNLLLDIEAMEEVRIVGICGMGGIGKTTIARTLFKRISNKFNGGSFVKDVRQDDICRLQEKILTDIVGGGHKIKDREDGAGMIQQRFCKNKVLLVLDDVDNEEQLEFLAANREWFGPGSRIIITTRDEHLLSVTDAKYKPDLLSMYQAVQLFSTHAFGTNCLPEGYKDLSDRAVRYTNRLPLALKVLGSFLRGRQAAVWESALDRLVKTPNKKIFETLKLSFDGLEESEKMIFLDIACFYKGHLLEHVTRVFDSLGYHAEIGINVLIEKCLISVTRRWIRMHDLIQEMGWQIVHESFPNSRLWLPDKISNYIKKKREPEAVEAIQCYNEKWREILNLCADVFESMENIRLLDVDNYFTSCQPTFLPEGLQYLFWFGYPFSSFPVVHMHNLVHLEMEMGKIKHLWEGKQIMPNLKIINLQHCDCLTRFPDVSGVPNIERLVLSGCEELVEVHESLGDLKRLVYLDMSGCVNLKHLPSRIQNDSLETLNLSICQDLIRLPEFSPRMVKLYHIDFKGCTSIEELPLSIRYLSNLSFLNLKGCSSLKNLPKFIFEFKCLKSLLLDNCQNLQKFPDEIGGMDKLEELQLGHTGVPINFYALKNLCSLRKLDLSWRDIRDEDFPKNLRGVSSLEELNLSGNFVLVQLPASIFHLSCLKHLLLNDCRELRKLHGLPSGIQVLEASNCKLLDKIEDLSEDHEFLYKINLFNCKLLKFQDNEDISEDNERYLDKMLEQPLLKKWAAVDGCLSIGIPGSKIPSWFKEQPGNEIALKLPPKWQTQIMGFAICGVFGKLTHHDVHEIGFRFQNYGAFDHISKSYRTNYASGQVENIWIGYIPFTLFEQIHDDDDDEGEGEDWSHIIEGNVIIDVGQKAVKCGAYAVYKEDVKSTHQIKPLVSPYYRNWSISRSFPYNNNVYVAR